MAEKQSRTHRPFQTITNALLLFCLVTSLACPGSTQASDLSGQTLLYFEDFHSYQNKDFAYQAEWDIWNHQTALGKADSLTQKPGGVTADTSGNTIYVWVDNRRGYPVIYAQKLDANGNRLWQEDRQVNSDTSVGEPSEVAAACAPDGSVFVTWSKLYNIYAQKLDAAGTILWDADLRVADTEKSSPGVASPSVAVGPDGTAWIAWTENNQASGDVYAQHLSADGNKAWAVAVRVSEELASLTSSASIAVGQDGQAVISWVDSRSGNGDIYAQKITAGGIRVWATDRLINTDGTTYSQYSPDLTIGTSGAIFFAWTSYDIGNTIFATKISADGSRLWDGDVQASARLHHYPQSNPTVALDATGNLFVGWSEWNHSGANQSFMYLQKLSSDGARLWQSDQRDSIDTASSSKQWLAAATMDSLGRLIIFFSNPMKGNTNLYARAVNDVGSPLWPKDVQVHQSDGRLFQDHPALATSDNGRTALAWTDYRNALGNIYVKQLDAAGAPVWDSDVQVSPESGESGQDVADISIDDSGTIMVGWEDKRSNYWDVFLQKLNPDGTKAWPEEVQLASQQSSEPFFDNNLMGVGIDFMGKPRVIWQRLDTSGRELLGQGFDVNGTRLWASNTSLYRGWHSSGGKIAVESNGKTWVAWQSDDSGNVDLYMQKLDGSGSKIWATDKRVNSGTGPVSIYYADITTNPTGAYIVWMDNRSGQYQVYAQRIDIAGARLWTGDLLIGDGRYPKAAVDPVGNLLVTWVEPIPSTSESRDSTLRLQKFNSEGTPLWPQPININGPELNIEMDPVIAVDAQGGITVAWVDIDFDANPSADTKIVVYQRFDNDGHPLGPVTPAMDPETPIYLGSGIIQSRTVDDTVRNIQSATLSADVTLNAGSLSFSLTNDGGSHWIPAAPGVEVSFPANGTDLRWKAELVSDPYSTSSPVIHTLQIAYTEGEYIPLLGDSYEVDDNCAQARPLAPNGAGQTHTFHQFGDADWVQFPVTAGKTYVLQTGQTGEQIDTILDLYRTCPEPPLATNDNAYGPEARITWTAAYTGLAYARVTNHDPAVYSVETSYFLSARVANPPPIVLITGGHDDRYSLQANIDHTTDRVYRTFINSGVPKANIRYLSPSSRDVDGNGLLDDIFGLPSPATVRDSIQIWSRTRGVGPDVPLYIVLVDHGHTDQFLVSGNEGKITAADLNQWLTNLEAASGVTQINVIIEACHSGSFIDTTPSGPASISKPGRVVISSTSSNMNAYPSVVGSLFSDAFWTEVGQNQDLKSAFEIANQAVQATGLSQQPWLDDNGDWQSTTSDGPVARTRGLGAAFAGSPPVIDWAELSFSTGDNTTMNVQVRDDFGIAQVWVLLFPPEFVEPAPTTDFSIPVLNVQTQSLTRTALERYSQDLDLSKPGLYRLVVYAIDEDGNQARPFSFLARIGNVIFLPAIIR